jgi:spore germination cell wall hydrolase CwlJ-like protein
MTRNSIDALKRADRAILSAFLFVLATAGAAIAYNPHTDESVVAARATPTVSQDLAPAPEPMKAFAGAPSPSELAMVKLLAEQKCLADAMYFEARGDGVRGEEAVAEVIFNRMRDANYPGTICGVVYEGARSGHGCQFSFACDGAAHTRREPGAWAQARLLAAQILTGYRTLGDETGGATSYHANYVEPGWTDMVQTAQIGNHIFFRRAGRHAITRGA